MYLKYYLKNLKEKCISVSKAPWFINAMTCIGLGLTFFGVSFWLLVIKTYNDFYLISVLTNMITDKDVADKLMYGILLLVVIYGIFFYLFIRYFIRFVVPRLKLLWNLIKFIFNKITHKPSVKDKMGTKQNSKPNKNKKNKKTRK